MNVRLRCGITLKKRLYTNVYTWMCMCEFTYTCIYTGVYVHIYAHVYILMVYAWMCKGVGFDKLGFRVPNALLSGLDSNELRRVIGPPFWNKFPKCIGPPPEFQLSEACVWCVAVSCTVLQCVLQWVAGCCVVCCSVLQGVAVRCTVLQWVAGCCSACCSM